MGSLILNIAILCEEKKYPKILKPLEPGPWRCFHIKTSYDAWVEMKKNDYAVFVFYFEDWQEKYEEVISLLHQSFPSAVVAVVTDFAPQETVERMRSVTGVGFFHFTRDHKLIVEGIEKLLNGYPVHYRKEERFRAYPYVEVKKDLMEPLKCRVANLSFSGAEISGSIKGLQTKEILYLEFQTGEKKKKIKAVVRWIAEGKTPSFGVEFI